jgi:8-oxo-dGTP pyrophosphatase MutT (NUDIX family)
MGRIQIGRPPDDLGIECAPGSRLRPTVRVLLIDPAGRLLLIRVRALDGGDPVWFIPGGGVEGDETDLEAAVREVAEETGLLDCPVGPEVWRRRAVLDIQGLSYDVRERYFVAYVETFDPVMTGLTPYEQTNVEELRWWSLVELAISRERFVPLDPSALFGSLMEVSSSRIDSVDFRPEAP